ncbi:MAG: CusA/CzcA family heavy metal efflux RND transporter [Gammaproteobacteria bacterium]|nr:CusA/CzcA family heavy metal efflux RND transporter [Gammaproteobacteria bacterium]|tara:strand:- start:17 stop:3109 length:3093 start_codon:yes stop_codon:yes gene_type:complete
MIHRIIEWSLENRLLVCAAAALLIFAGGRQAIDTPVDVFPDLTAPSVTIVTDAPGMTPEDVERQISYPIESSLNGASGVRRVRSVNGIGISVITVEFDWSADIFQARQVVSEKLAAMGSILPENASAPTMAPVTSIMGEIMFLALTSSEHDAMTLRSTADWTVRRRLLAVPGVAEVINIGGEIKQFQVIVQPERMSALGVTIDEVYTALRESGQNASAGFMTQNGQEYLIQGLGNIHRLEEIGQTFVKMVEGRPVLVDDLGVIDVGAAPVRGTGAFNAETAVVLGIQKQPDANTLRLTRQLDETLADIQSTLPAGMEIRTDAFRQATFIETANDNLTKALIEGAVLVTAIIFLFLFSGRAIAIVLIAIPLSLIAAVLVIQAMGGSVNTMTLGGLVIALGALVDDAIIVVENTVRHLKERNLLPVQDRPNIAQTVLTATSEVQSSIVFATLIIVLVFVPLFFLSGVEGRLLQPLGIAYVAALATSLLVALTITPVLCQSLLPESRSIKQSEETKFLQTLKRAYRPVLDFSLRYWRAVIATSVALLIIAGLTLAGSGRGFLPEFNEGALTVSVTTLPGTSLQTSSDIGLRVEQILLAQPEVVATTRRTGRAELDPHAQQVFASEVDVILDVTSSERPALMERLRQEFAVLPGTNVVIGQPLSHRIDHMLSGTRANIAIKLFGPDLFELRRIGREIETLAASVPGAVDVAMDAQSEIPLVSVTWDRAALANYGLRVASVSQALEAAFGGRAAGEVREGEATYDLVIRMPEYQRESLDHIRNTIITLDSGAQVPFSALAKIEYRQGPNTITREGVARNLVIMANVAERDLISVVEEIEQQIEQNIDLPAGYHVEFGGQFESLDAASSRLLILGTLVIVGIFALLFAAFGRLRDTWLVMLNLPLALIGGVAGVWFAGNTVTIASIIGFITLFGIATRNGVILVDHIRRLMTHRHLSVRDAVIQGAEERLAPILMTALGTALALIPLAAAAGEPGSEIQAPMAMVILYGLVSSTILNMLVVPCIFSRFAGETGEKR